MEKKAKLDLESYFSRIRYDGSTEPSERTLRDIHAQQSAIIPFENIDIHLDRPISLRIEDLFAKLVDRRRGGYCYELNGLLQYVLERLGFHVMVLAARTRLGVPAGLPKTHKALLVAASARHWIVDAGFGSYGLSAPIPFDIGTAHHDGADRYRIRQTSNPVYTLERFGSDTWEPLYDFSLVPMQPSDFEMMNYYHSTCHASRFRNGVIVSLLFKSERRVLLDLELRTGQTDRPRVLKLCDAQAYQDALLRTFAMDLGDDAGTLFDKIVAQRGHLPRNLPCTAVNNVGED